MTAVVLLLPSLARCRAIPAVASGVLARWIARGDALDSATPGTEGAWRSVFEWPGTSLPVAALTRQFDLGDAAGAGWLRADPAHVRADMATARMLACGDLGLSVDETVLLARDLKPLFGDAGLIFEAPDPQRWYLRAETGTPLPDAASPDDVLGDDLKLHLPAGAAGKRWRMLYNESQVLLHNHVVNARRTARGAVSVNSLWFWGAGTLPAAVRSSAQAVMTAQPALLSLAQIAGIRALPLEPSALAGVFARNAGECVLVDLAGLRDAQLEHAWLAPLDLALRGSRIERIDLVFQSGERNTIRGAHRWRLWRRVSGCVL